MSNANRNELATTKEMPAMTMAELITGERHEAAPKATLTAEMTVAENCSVVADFARQLDARTRRQYLETLRALCDWELTYGA
jgi:hypothetical protein